MAKLKFLSLSFLRGATAGVLLLLIAMTAPVHAQPVLGAQNIALGGGGTAYLDGFEASFWNPANMAINSRQGTLHFGVGHAGVLFEPVLSTDVAGDQFFNFTDSYYPYKPGSAVISSAERRKILNTNYPRNNLVSQHQTRADIILGGLSWQHNGAAFSLAARARFASRIEVGRGWYSENFYPKGDAELRDFTLDQQINQLFEISLGYAREFTFIDGLLPRISKLYIGIAPKLVLAGPSFNATYNARYIRSAEDGSRVYATDFFYRTTGKYSAMTLDYLSGSNPQRSINQNLNRLIKLDNTGYGFGFDFGLTYLVPLGNELNIIEETPDESVISKSLRFSFSVNDIGMIRYNDQPLQLSSPQDTIRINAEPTKNDMFIGSGGQYLHYFDNTSTIPNPVANANSQSKKAFSQLLPTSLNAGILIDFSRIKLMGDLTLGFNNTAFTNTKLAVHLGLEGRPLKQVPIRIGARLASKLPTHIGIGTGFESRYWDFTIGSQIILRSQTFTTEVAGGAFAGIQLHL